ncbi:MAG: hypothetical protein AB7O96_17790 [Pseudobdellovibrionaceae bacterium]
MEDSGLPEALRHFIEIHIKSVASLEALLLLRASPSRQWTPEELSQEMRSNPFHAASLLDELASKGLLLVQKNPDKKVYSLENNNPELLSRVEQLHEAYLHRRLSVINQIYFQPVDKLRSLADAFKIRKE